MSHEVGGLWDDAEEALRWRPALPLVKRVREAKGVERADAIRDLALFALRNAGLEPWESRAFRLFSLVVDLARKDERVLAALNDIVPLA